MRSTYVLAALLHLQKVVNLGHSVQFLLLRLYLHFRVVFCVRGFHFGVSFCQNPDITSRNGLRTNFSQRVPPVVFDCLQPITSRPREKLDSTPTPCRMLENMSRSTLERSAYFECVSSCCRHQSVMSGIQNVLLILH